MLTGTSNKVYTITNQLGIFPEKLIYRFFGSSEVTDKERERKIFNQLYIHNLAPRNYGESSVSRIEEYLDNYVTMTINDFYDHQTIEKICRRIKEFHSLDMNNILNSEVPMFDIKVMH